MTNCVFKKQNIIVLLFCCFVCLKLTGQQTSDKTTSFSPQEIWQTGLPYIQNFTPENYGGNPQNWGFTEGLDGLIYIANGAGVIEYDGNTWRLISLPVGGMIRSIHRSDEGKIYVGGVGEFGFLKKNQSGETVYQSLSEKLDMENLIFNDIWSMVSSGKDVFFASRDFLFKWNGNEIKVWKPNESFGNMFRVNDKIYLRSKGVGILELQGDSLRLISDGDYFLNSRGRISMMEKFQENKILLGHSLEGLFIYDGNSMIPFNDDTQNIFRENNIYKGTSLQDGNYLITTLNSGVYLVSAQNGEIIHNYRRIHGLTSDIAIGAYCASDGSLWLGTDSGISRIDFPSPLRRFDEKLGLAERIRSVSFDGNTIFVASKGLFILKKHLNGKILKESIFKGVKGIDKNVNHIIPVSNHKLVIQDENVFDLDENNNPSLVKSQELLRYAQKSNIEENSVYVTSTDGALYKYELIDKEWKSILIAKIQGEITKITEEKNGTLWLNTNYQGIYRIKNPSNDLKENNIKLEQFDTISGLPSMKLNSSFLMNGNLHLSNMKNGIYNFNAASEVFEKDTVLMKEFSENVNSFGPISFDINGNFWQAVGSNDNNEIYQMRDNKLQVLTEYKTYPEFQTFDISRADDIMLFSGPSGILAYNPKAKREEKKLPDVQIREILIKSDSMIYGGRNGVDKISLPHKLNSMELQYSLPFYTRSDKNEYQYQLVGFDDEWSTWSFDTKKYYTNIPEGDYTFKVRGKNVFGEISEEDRYSFTILPPWYRTWWAYVFYGLGAILTVILFSQLRSKQLRAKNLALEKVIDERTYEIKEKNLLLENQTEKLKELDTMKTRLFANISHEFRTPLTLIKGPVEKMESEGVTTLSTTNVKMIRRNANRLLNLVNQLLDLSKLDSGKLRLNPAEGDIFKCVRAAVSSFASHAAQRDIDYQISIPSRALWANFDRDKIEKVVYNLLSNAFKFTQDKGRISVNVTYRSGRLQLTVADTGQGIKKDKLPNIFDRFFQVDDSYTKEKSGSGIGLALTKELIELMQGEIYVESEFGKGSTFKVVLELEEIKSPPKKSESLETPLAVSAAVEETALPLVDSNKTEFTVMIIEDNNDMRHFIREQLQNDYAILEAVNGAEGLKKATKIIPDLIITDLMMPQMDGITLCKKLKTGIHTSHIPVVMLTAKAGIENKLEGLETGADDYLTKPFNARELQVRVKNLINERQKLRELYAQKPDINPKEITVTSLDEKFLGEVLELLEEKHIDSEFGVPQMQKALGMSKTQLHRKLKALTDHPPGELLRNFRLKRAAQLLLQKGENVSQIAYAVGFNGLSYFTKCFKELYGVAPSDYVEK